jgi:hypothetical protein
MTKSSYDLAGLLSGLQSDRGADMCVNAGRQRRPVRKTNGWLLDVLAVFCFVPAKATGDCRLVKMFTVVPNLP